jgi:fucose 4-O-acetylase-like acetyltransferase
MDKRVDYIDLAKAVAIILVIVGHCFWHGVILDRLIYAFHMPLFFIISGFFVKELNFKEGVKKYSKAYLKPYFLTCAIILFVTLICCYRDGNNLLETIRTWLVTTMFASGWSGGSELFATIPMIGQIWFLVAIFWSCFLYSLLKKYDLKWRLIITTLLLLFGSFSVRYIRLPFSLQAGMGGIFFLCVGDIIREKDLVQWFFNLKIQYKTILSLYCILIAIAIGGVGAVTCSYGGKFIPLVIPMSIISCLAVMSVCKKMNMGGVKLEEILYIF